MLVRQLRLYRSNLRGCHTAVLFAAIVSLAVLVCAGRPVFAVNTGFLPGDACFGSALSQETLAQFDADQPVVFPYSPGAGMGGLCGYAGYWHLAVPNLTKETKANLQELYRHLREFEPAVFQIWQDENGNEHRRETNPYRVFIYHKDYDVAGGIGLKFNESWMSLIHYKTRKPISGAYSPYVTDYRAVARDWERGPQVPALPINERHAQPWWGPQIEEPVSIDAAKIQILVLPDDLHPSFAWGSNSSPEEQPRGYDDEMDGRYFYRVTDEGVTRCHWNSPNDFVEEPWPIEPVRKQAAQIQEVIKTLDRANTDTYGIDDEELSAELRKSLDKLRDKTDSLIEEFKEFVREIKPEATPEAGISR